MDSTIITLNRLTLSDYNATFVLCSGDGDCFQNCSSVFKTNLMFIWDK